MPPSKKTPDTKPIAKKRGKQSDIQGKHDTYLQPFIAKYVTVAKAHKSLFWKEFFPDYWAAFPWRLPLDQDPAEDDKTDYARPPANDEGVDTEKKIKLWFSRHRVTNTSGNFNPYTKWLAQLRRPPGFAPKKLAPYQHYMQHPSYKEKVSKELEGLHGNPPTEARLKLLSKVACESEHKQKLAEHRSALEGLPSLEPAEQAEACKRFGSAVWPLLDALRAHTGYDITLFAGLVEFEEGKLPAVNCVRWGLFVPDFMIPGLLMKGVAIVLLSVHAEVNSETPPELDFAKAPNYDLSLKGFGRFVWDAYLYHAGQAVRGAAPPPVDATSTDGTKEPLPPADPAPAAISGPAADTAPTTIDGAAAPAPPAAVAASPLPGSPTPGAAGATYEDSDDFPEELVPDVPDVPDIYASGFAGDIGAELRVLLVGMMETARAEKIIHLKTLDAEALRRENNGARNHYLLDGMGLGEASKEMLWGGRMLLSWDQREQQQSRRGRGASFPATTAGASSTASTATAHVSPAEGMVDEGQKRSHKQRLWRGCAMPYLTGVRSQTRSHSAKQRPKQVGDWIQRARNYTPTIEDTDEYAKQWWAWWIDINPAWREKKRPMLRDRDARWESMNYH
ncbi:hypothetical protein B0H11DRAFT_2251877 [Mycena galericulata]|nr:hypothetical protein B0H11DRAFT_2251877 [Mycena galericulata]